MNGSEMRERLEELHAASYGWAMSCCSRDRSEAEVVLQTVYLKVLEGKARFDGKSSFKTWLFSVIRRTAADRRRRKILSRLRLVGYDRKTEEIAGGERPDEAVYRSQLQEMFGRALADLPARQREVLQLVFYHDFTIAEAARVMCVSLGAARTHYERGKAKLRRWMEESKVIHESGFGRKQNQEIVP
ncbi:MAG: RNA polymerase sigma factor [Blastocatellia bacterium]|nr:RNA polymerase sigma factor [Blastocatellia bacterium]